MELRHLRYFVAVAEELVRREPIVCALPEGHPLARQERIAVSMLANEPFVLQSRQHGGGYYVQLMKLCLASGFSPNVVQEVTEMHTIVGLVAAGIGVSLVPQSMHPLKCSCGFSTIFIRKYVRHMSHLHRWVP